MMAVFLAAAAPGVFPGSYSAHADNEEGSRGPTVLLILDGYGLSEKKEHNAIALADTPVMDRLMKECPFATGNPELFGIARFRGLWYALVGI
jgi:hypothetical protein